jgi:MATE family multidrug resistance protein
MMVAITQNIVNILASLFFVFVLHMQVEGVALGTLVAQWVGFALSLKWRSLSVEWKVQSVEFATARQDTLNEKTDAVANSTLSTLHSTLCTFHSTLFTVNRDIFFRTLCLVAVNLYFTSAGAQQGTLVLAVNTLLMQLFTIFSYFMDGFAYAGEALAGRYYGAGNRPMLHRVVRSLFAWGALMVVLFTLLYGVGGEAFLSLLTTDAEVIAASADYFLWALLIPVCGVAAFVWDGIFIGITATRGMLEACFVAALAFFAIWFGGRNALGNHALWLALNAYLLLRGVVQTVVFRKRYAY